MFIPFPSLYTSRLVLRRLEESDWEEIRFLRSDNVVNRFVKRPKAETKLEAIAFIQKIHQGSLNSEMVYWCISLQSNPTMIGSICLWKFTADRKIAEVGYDLNPAFQKNGDHG